MLVIKLPLKLSAKVKSTWHFRMEKKIKAHYTKGMWVLKLCNDNKNRSHRNMFTSILIISWGWPFPGLPKKLSKVYWNTGPSTGLWCIISWLKRFFFLNLSLIKDNSEALKPMYNISDKVPLLFTKPS